MHGQWATNIQALSKPIQCTNVTVGGRKISHSNGARSRRTTCRSGRCEHTLCELRVFARPGAIYDLARVVGDAHRAAAAACGQIARALQQQLGCRRARGSSMRRRDADFHNIMVHQYYTKKLWRQPLRRTLSRRLGRHLRHSIAHSETGAHASASLQIHAITVRGVRTEARASAPTDVHGARLPR